jgi:hypothetical protein
MEAGVEEVKEAAGLRSTLFSAPALIALIVLAGSAGVGCAIKFSVRGGIVAAGAVFILWLLITIVIGVDRAKQTFYAAYAQERGLEWVRGGPIPASTPLLRRGDRRTADETFTGVLPGGLQGTMALYTYEETSVIGTSNSPTGQSKELHHFTVVVAAMPETAARLPSLFVQRRSGFRFLDGAEDVFRRTVRLTLESEALDKRCEIFTDPSCDQIWLRRLFSPTFVDFLASETPKDFAVEVENGTLCVNVYRHRGKANELDAIARAASSVAERIRAEIAESAPA